MTDAGAIEARRAADLTRLKAAAAFLLITSAIQVGSIAFGLTPAMTLPVDIILGIQLLRLRVWWRIAALARAWAALVMAAFLPPALGWTPGVWFGLAIQIGYAATLLLLLLGAPRRATLVGGRVAAVVTTAILIGAVVWGVGGHHAAPS